MPKRRTTRDCPSCGKRYSCVWAEDQWYCRSCGDEWPWEQLELPEDRCSECGASLLDNEGYDGLCGSCADVAEAAGRWG